MAASTVGLGTLSTTTAGVSHLFGSSSEIDTDALVSAMTGAKRLPALRLENRITVNEARQKAYAELRDLLAGVREAAAKLRNPPGTLGLQGNVFEAKEAYYSSDTTVSPASLLAVSPDASATTGSYRIVVRELATARKLMTDAVGSATADLATERNGGNSFTGIFNLGTAGGGNAPITVTGSMDLQDVRAAINAVSATTGVTASVLQVSSTEARLVLTATNTGREVTLAPVSGDDVLKITGLSADGGVTFKNSIQLPKPAKLDIDDVPVERPTNRITDVLSGLTIDLYRSDPGTTVAVEVGRSLAGIKEAVSGLVEKLNALRDFVDRHSAVSSDGTVDESAILFGDSTLRGVAQAVSGAVSGRVAGLPAAAAASLGSLGITMDESNHLVLNGSRLDAALLGDLEAVRNVLEFRFSASSSDLQLFARGGRLADTSFRVDVVDADADGKPESATIDGVSVDVDGQTLVGKKGTAYEGLELMWTGKGSASIDATATSGISEQLFTAVDGLLTESEGALAKADSALTDANDRYRKEIERIDQRVEDYRARLIERFAAMESALALAKSIMQQVQASTDAMFAKQ
jgi:flagellar hook-associated protein 2